VVGGGLAGSEAAWQLASRGHAVALYEMRPHRSTPAHKTANFAELVCTNSLKSFREGTAPGLFKSEISRFDSLILNSAREAAVPAGQALAVDRDVFAERVNEAILGHPLIDVRREAVERVPAEGVVIMATGPLTTGELLEDLVRVLGTPESLYFFDAISPIVDAESIDLDAAFPGGRYERGDDDYLNCPLSEAEYDVFHAALLTAERAPIADFESSKLFEMCLPLEELAARGKQTLLFGPFKPVGLVDPKTGRRPFAVVQLRREKAGGEMYNLVGCQTRLKYPEQKRIFKMIPGLAEASFLRLGSMHRNAYVDSPRVLDPTLEVRTRPGLFLAGQITGCEGYTEATGTGLIAALGAAARIEDRAPCVLPPTTILGALTRYISNPEIRHFQPMNVNFGLLPPIEPRIRNKRDRNLALHRRSLEELDAWRSAEKIFAGS
jgi:methylenetetrahydrofolate--tRNA-(uracil-5-)-methyltransferase